MTVSVLIVDDDPAFRRLAAELLGGNGYAIAGEAADAAHAIEALARLRPDAALVDVGLPDMDGIALARRLADDRPQVRIVLTSSDPYDLDPAALEAAGAVAFVAKPELAVVDLAAHLG